MNSISSSSSLLLLRRNQLSNIGSDFNERKGDTEKENKKTKFITATEGGYVRIYLVKEDGTKILLSETKQVQDNKGSSDQTPLLPSEHANIQAQSASSVNTKEMMLLLNLNAGIPINIKIFGYSDYKC